MVENKKTYYAHSPKGRQTKWETLVCHSNEVANSSAQFCGEFGFYDEGKIAGLLHDIGKYQQSFQNKLKGANCDVEHSICGAKEALELLKIDKSMPINAFNREILAYIIAGHHSGLPDCGTAADNIVLPSLSARLKRKTENYETYKQEISIMPPTKNWLVDFNCYDDKERYFACSILTRMMYSALVDSDSLETEKFYTGNDRAHNYSTFECLKSKLDNYVNSFPQAKSGSINEKRNEIQNFCLNKASFNKGIYSLKVPTGGGKTISSMVFAINHLLKRGHKRIIYVIPYTAIIEQMASIFKGIFGEENVLEHHSNFTYEDDSTEGTPQFLATENWDSPIVFTTNVQFFESIFSNKRGSSRKLHNIANSVIVFDEAQMLPIPLLKPCLKTIDILTRNFNCTALLMSATCPNYLPYMCKDATITEINVNYQQHYKDFKRITAEYIGVKTDEELLKLVDVRSQTLIVVNSRRHANKLFNSFPTDCNKYHLSTLMCPKHRKEIFTHIKSDLMSNKPCIVVSTQLIECGVDFDFATVFRSLAGIDSIVQAGGRCNREGKRENSKVYVFEASGEPKLGTIAENQSIARTICQNTQEDIFSLDSINKYFSDLLNYRDSQTDKQKIMELFRLGAKKSDINQFYLQFEFAKCNEMFHYIESADKYGIIVPIDSEAEQLIKQVQQGNGNLNLIFRKLCQYTVSVYKWEYENLKKQSKLEEINNERLSLLKNCNVNYDNAVGLKLTTADTQYNEILII